MAPRSREYVIVENIRQVCVLDLTADFGVKSKLKIDAELPAAREEQNWYSGLSVHSNPAFNFCLNFLTYIL